MFRYVYLCSLLVIFIGFIAAQFPNPFTVLSNVDTGSNKNTTGCNQKSCAPWCSMTMDGNGCIVCTCNTGGMSPLSGLSPMVGGMTSMGGGVNPIQGNNPLKLGVNPLRPGINPFTSMYSDLMRGGISSQHVDNHTGRVECNPAPTTCPAPQPWCQRLPDSNTCITCVCGKELITLLSKNVQSTTQQPVTSIDTNTQQPTTTTVTTTKILETTNQMQSCIDNFFCSKICNHGYKTNNINCPVCECMDGTPLSTLADGTMDISTHSPTTAGTPAVTDHVTSCPGIFDCGLICNNGYKTDLQGCPVCDCEI